MLGKTFFMIKPDGLSRNLESEILNRIKKTGLKIIQQKAVWMSVDQAQQLYSPHQGKSFYPGLIKFITSGPVICAQLEGEDAVSRLRNLMGETDPSKAAAGTIRGDLSEADFFTPEGVMKNLVHGSDSPSSAQREITVFFSEEGEQVK